MSVAERAPSVAAGPAPSRLLEAAVEAVGGVPREGQQQMAEAVAEALAAGRPAAQIKRGLRMPSFAADRLISDVSKRDVEAFRRALVLMADLELESRGGGGGVLSEDTAAVRAVIGAAR